VQLSFYGRQLLLFAADSWFDDGAGIV